MFRHAWASFCADFPSDPDPAELRCETVGEYLAARLREAGLCVTATDNWRDSGWSVDCRVNGKRVYFFVTYYGQAPVGYVLCCTSDRGLVGWLRGVNDVPERWQLARAVHRVLAADSRFREIRWYVEQGWTGNGNDPWVAEPA